MDRLPDGRWREPVRLALAQVRPWRHIIGEVRFVAGVDPVFAGVHEYVDLGPEYSSGNTFATVPHCCYPWHLRSANRRDLVPTIVLPRPTPPSVIVHELGHVLDFRLGFKFERPAAVTSYAHTNRNEAFAEYFVAHRYHHGNQDVYGQDDTRHHLDSLRSAR